MQKKIYYAAYGSNINLEQMEGRCPHSKVVATGKILDYQLCFDYHADIRPRQNNCVPVLLWDIADDDWARLDRYEGYPKYYVKKTVTVFVDTLTAEDEYSDCPDFVEAIVYVMTEGKFYSFPSEDYYHIIVQGYDENCLDINYLRDAIYYTAVKMEWSVYGYDGKTI